MSTIIHGISLNLLMIKQYCKPHKIDPSCVISIQVESIDQYCIEYINKDGHYCTMSVRGASVSSLVTREFNE